MLKINKILLIIFLVLPGILFCQSQQAEDKPINLKDSKGRKQGFWKKIESGTVKYEGTFKDDKPVGQFKYYYPGGKVKAITYFTNNGDKGRSTAYHKNGMKMAAGNYLGEEKDSLWLYYNENEKLVSEVFYSKGKKHGLSRTYFPDGKPDEDIYYVNDNKEGEWKQYFTDGAVKLKATYKNGKLQGLMTVYYPAGTVMISGTYKDSLKDGWWYYFDEMSKTQKKEYWVGGLKAQEVYFDKKLQEEIRRRDSIK
ncbi:MAG: toxin-antitoxin system YwqK family antitoxin [Bacteroidales bacterium]